MSGRKIELLFTEDTPIGRVRAVVLGQTCGPSLPSTAAEFNANRHRYQEVFQAIFDRGVAVGTRDTQNAVWSALGLSK